MTGWYDSWATAGRQPELCRAAEHQEEPAAADRRALDPQPAEASYAGEAQFTADAALDLQAFQAALVRSLAEGRRQRRRSRAARADLRDGRRRRAQDAARAASLWGPLARRAGVAARADEADALLLCTRTAASRPRHRRPARPADLPVRPATPSADARRQRLLAGNADVPGGAADQRCRPDFWPCADAKPLSARDDVLVFQTRAAEQATSR